ncbi:MAG: radical SAM protein [Patescibacteria group bacterium]
MVRKEFVVLENTVTTFAQSKNGRKLSSKRVLFHLPERLLGYEISSKEVIQTALPPVSVALCPTPMCVRKCSFCSNNNRNKENRDKKLEIQPQKFVELVDGLSRLDVKGATVAGGGEPLSYNGPIIERLFLCSNPSFKIGLHTNDVLLEKILNDRIFKSNNMAYVNVSVVAHKPELYEKICNSHPKQFYKVEKNIIDMLRLKILTGSNILLGVKILLCRENFSFAKDMFDYFKNIGVENILVRCVGNFEHGQDVELLPEQINYLIRAFKEIGMNNDQVAAVTGCNSEPMPIPSKCWICALQYTAGVDPDGEVYLCSQWSKKEYSIGNINQLDICGIWGSEKHKETAKRLNDNLQNGKCNPLLCRHYHSNLAIDAFISKTATALPKADLEKGYGRFI